MFHWVFNRFYFLSRVLHQSRDFSGVTSVWGVSAVAILYSSVHCVCVWSTKKLTMPAYCGAAICNNSQTTPGIPMHEHFSECDFANSMEYRMGFASKLTRCSSTLSKSCLTDSNWYGCILAGSLWQSISFVFGARVGHFAATPQSDVVGIWSRDLGVMAMLSVRQKMPLFRAFMTLRSQFHLHHRSQRALTEIVSKITPNLGLVL